MANKQPFNFGATNSTNIITSNDSPIELDEDSLIEDVDDNVKPIDSFDEFLASIQRNVPYGVPHPSPCVVSLSLINFAQEEFVLIGALKHHSRRMKQSMEVEMIAEFDTLFEFHAFVNDRIVLKECKINDKVVAIDSNLKLDSFGIDEIYKENKTHATIKLYFSL